MGYCKEREALASIVQAMLMTKHMLFVGFSLDDPNFHQIVHDVRRVTHGHTVDTDQTKEAKSPRKMGTNLTLFNEPLSKSLWKNDLDWLPMLDEGYSDDRIGVASRHLEIFLDQLALESTDATRHVLDSDFQESLSPPDQQMKTDFEDFLRRIKSRDSTAAGKRLFSLAKEMGYKSN